MKPTRLDHQEKAILAKLQADARISVQELSEAVGLSTSPTWRRVKSLEERGIINGYVALLDAEKLGYTQCVIAHVTLSKHEKAGIEEFERSVSQRPEVMEFLAMTGDADYLLRVLVRDTKQYEAFLQEAVFTCASVQHIRSNFALRQIKFTVNMPLDI
ncbi:MAG TPA: Lrp/AsnC family transcriptional regulator [Pseudolabrys sp.]|nr:Lrp/AsnC family transcriptional regulator [Pseudolabrys sp.]